MGYVIIAGYTIATFATICDFSSRSILDPNVIRFADFRRYDGFSAGPLLLPVMALLWIITIVGNVLWLRQSKPLKIGDRLPLIAGLILSTIIALGIIGFYIKIYLADMLLGIGMAASALIFLYSILKFHVFSEKEKILLNIGFYSKSVLILIIIILYTGLLMIFLPRSSYTTLILSCLMIILVMFTHSFYDWFNTFINDLSFNFSSGLSVVTDEEVSQLIKYYNSPQKLEDSPLLRLKIVQNKMRQGMLGVDALRELLQESIRYFEPKHEQTRRIKSNLKFNIIIMIAFNEAEEGQILWNLGFDEYPLRIMSQAGHGAAPLFSIKSPTDYSFTSRNAYLALKKEAIHNIAWRISYLERNR